MRVQLTLYKKVIFLIVFVIFVSLLTTYSLILGINDTLIAQRIESTSKGIAARVASVQLIKDHLLENSKSTEIQSFIISISESTISNIVIFDMNGNILFANHPFTDDSQLFVEEAKKTAFLGPDEFSINDELRSRSYYSKQMAHKIFDTNDKEIGIIVVADLPSEYELHSVRENLFLILLANTIGLVVGIFGAVSLVKNTKDTLLGMEPEEIAQIMQERSAMINSVQEGILCVNTNGEITLINSSAQRIFSHAGLVRSEFIGLNMDHIYTSGIKNVLYEGVSFINHNEKINNITIITNQVPVLINNQIVGAIMTFRLKTELEALAQQLTGVKEYADALRAQTHEFLNKMHVILGLINTAAYDELRQYVKGVTAASTGEVQYIRERIRDSVLSGFVFGKISRARELDIDFSLTEESYLPASIAPGHIDKIISIIGNLLNNAFDVLKNYDLERIVLLAILSFDEELIITVEDSGPGIPEKYLSKIFVKGFSTKGENHGFGLYLVKQILDDYSGSIEVESTMGEGTIFTVKIPFTTIRKEE